MTIFWGLVNIREFNYRFTNSVAYYDILTLDAPKMPSYDDEDESGENKEVKVDEASIRKNKEALERALKRKNKIGD